MKVSTSITASSETLLSGWERALLILPALAGLGLGFILVFLPGLFASLAQFMADDAYIYQLAGAAILGYGVALSFCLFQPNWLTVRLVVIGVLVNNICSLYACVLAIFSSHAPYSVYVFLLMNIVFIAICGLLLARHQNVSHPESNFSSRSMQFFLIVGAIAAGVFGVFPLFVPNLFTFFHLHINAPFIIQEAGAASMGYAVVAVLAQRSLNRQELPLITIMGAIFNGVGGLVSIPYLLAGTILLLPLVIAPVGLIVLVVCLVVLRQMVSETGR